MNQQQMKALAVMAKAKETIADSPLVEVSKPKAKPVIAEGTFLAVITNAEKSMENTRFGENLRLTVIFSVIKDADKEPIEVRQYYWFNPKPDSPFYRHFEIMLGKDPTEIFVLKHIIGGIYEITIVHAITETGTYANVDTLKKVLINPNEDTEEITI